MELWVSPTAAWPLLSRMRWQVRLLTYHRLVIKACRCLDVTGALVAEVWSKIVLRMITSPDGTIL